MTIGTMIGLKPRTEVPGNVDPAAQPRPPTPGRAGPAAANGTPPANGVPPSTRNPSRPSPIEDNGVARPLTQRPTRMDPPAPERESPPDVGWTLLIGAVFGLAIVKEILARMGGHPVTNHAKSAARAGRPLSKGLLLVMLERLGAHALGIRARG